MQTVPYRLVTIVAESTVRDRLLSAIHRLGATGHTMSEVRGEGTRGGMQGATWERPSVKIETIVTVDVAEQIANHVAENYFRHHSVIVYLQDVEVLRGSKYAPQNEEA
ncbi:MAG: transcriptional regulator [Bacteroidota bacterium]